MAFIFTRVVVPLVYILLGVVRNAWAAPARRSQRRVRVISADDLKGSCSAEQRRNQLPAETDDQMLTECLAEPDVNNLRYDVMPDANAAEQLTSHTAPTEWLKLNGFSENVIHQHAPPDVMPDVNAGLTLENMNCVPSNKIILTSDSSNVKVSLAQDSLEQTAEGDALTEAANITSNATIDKRQISVEPPISVPKIITAATAVGNLQLAAHIPSDVFHLNMERVWAMQREAARRGLLQEHRHSKFGHQTLHTYLHLAADEFPDVVDTLWNLAVMADDAADWGVASMTGSIPKRSLRCLEIIDYSSRPHDAPSRHSGWHDDGDTVFTVSVLLSTPGYDFEGGDLEVRRKVPGAKVPQQVHVSPRKGDALIWRGWEEHRVLPVTQGIRRVLVAEWRLDFEETASKTDVRPLDSKAGLQRLLQLDPLSPTLYKNFGNLLLAQGKARAAASTYSAGLAKDPMYAEGHYHLGALALEQGAIDVAEKHFRLAIQFEPLHVGSKNNLGVILDRRGEKQAAEMMYLDVIATDPQHAEAHDNLGVLLASRGDSGSAERSFEAAVKANPEHVNGHRNLGVMRKKRGDVVGAENCFQTMVKLVPHSADAHSSLANVLAMQGKGVDAATSFQAALEIQPNHKVTLESLVAHYKLLFQIDPCLQRPVAQQLKCFNTVVQLESILNRASRVIDLLDVITAAKNYIAVHNGEQRS